MFKTRGPQAIRVLQGLLSLAEKHPVAQLEHACQQALEYGAWRLRDLRALLERAPAKQLTFLEKHPLIRDLEAYGNIVPVLLCPRNRQPTTITRTCRMNTNNNLDSTLKALRLSGLAQSLPVRLQEVAANRLSHGEFLELIRFLHDFGGIGPEDE
ncbi:MAG TPA: hypothetical protein PKZ55_06885 [Verrucomicrobiota bacterium]|nr:hypothetical protein [Verrucomicrobiota bacterium]